MNHVHFSRRSFLRSAAVLTGAAAIPGVTVRAAASQSGTRPKTGRELKTDVLGVVGQRPQQTQPILQVGNRL